MFVKNWPVEVEANLYVQYIVNIFLININFTFINYVTEMYLSTSCSSFEMLDPHDPIISRLATHLFKKTNDYLQGEMSAGQVTL